MNKAIVVGCGSGIGYSICKKLIEKGYYIEMFSRHLPDGIDFDKLKYNFHYCDLMDFNEEIFLQYADDNDISLMFLSAGVGRVADFEYHHIAEIDKMFTINTISILKIIKIFYKRIASDKKFYTGAMCSISGRLSSPATSVYASSKAALFRFIESVNIELECNGFNNRILEVSPASYTGSSFYGGNTDLNSLEKLSSNILNSLFSNKTLYIPHYDDIFADVFKKYNSNPHEYGIHSYAFKKESERFDNSKRLVVGYLSGTFDLFHIGHLNLLRNAKKECDYLIVGVHKSGAWKHKETFIPLDERKEILKSCRYVDKVVDSCPEDSDAWQKWHFDKLFVGSDYKGTKRFSDYENYFKDKNVKIIYFPYTKTTSSTQIRNMINSIKP